MGELEESLSKCCEKDILAADVFKKNGEILASEDTEINPYIKNKLGGMGVARVRIYGLSGNFKTEAGSYGEFRKKYKDTVLQIKSALNDLAAGKQINYRKVNNITELIYKNIHENDHILKCLQEVRHADEYTYTHSLNTAFYSMLIGKWLGLSDHDIKNVIQSGLLHDIGKSKVPVDILNKKGILTKSEYELIKEHTIFGYDMLNDMKDIDPEIKQAVLFHHERKDRSGYPINVPPECVNIYAKIVAVADVYDAMTTDRVYKKRSTPFEAFEMFQTVGLGMFDQTVINVFLKHMAAFYVGSRVVLCNGEKGRIVDIPPQDITHPVVRLHTHFIDLSSDNTVKVDSLI